MAKKTATYADYELRVEDNGKIVILNAGQAVQNAMGAIRTIASEVGFTLDPKWNTQSSGRKLVDFINSSTPATASTSKPEATEVAAKTEPKQAPTPTPKPEINKVTVAKSEPKQAPASTENSDDKPVKRNTESTDIELTEEEMKQLDDILKRLESLEARIAKLENKPAGVSSKNDNAALRVVATHTAPTLYAYRFNSSGKLEFDINLYQYMGLPENKKYLDSRLNQYSRWRESINNGDFSQGIERTFIQPAATILELSDGNFYTINAIGSTLREVKAFATLVGYPIPDKAKTDTLAAAIVRERGVDGWCFADGQAMKSTGTVYRYNKLTKQNIINMIKQASNYSSFIIEEPDVNGKSEGELAEAYVNMFNTAKPRELPSIDEILRQFDEALRIEKLKLQE